MRVVPIPPRPSAESRRSTIATLLARHGTLTTADVTARLRVSRMTVIRDFEVLSSRGLARRAHGGLISVSVLEPSPADAVWLSEAARRAARQSAELVRSGEVVMLDASPVAAAIGERILELRRGTTIITNSLVTMGHVGRGDESRASLVSLPGRLDRATGSFVGPPAVAALSRWFADRAFISATLDERGAAIEPDRAQAELKRIMVSHAHVAHLLPADPPALDGIEIGKLVGARLEPAADARGLERRPADRVSGITAE